MKTLLLLLLVSCGKHTIPEMEYPPSESHEKLEASVIEIKRVDGAATKPSSLHTLPNHKINFKIRGWKTERQFRDENVNKHFVQESGLPVASHHCNTLSCYECLYNVRHLTPEKKTRIEENDLLTSLVFQFENKTYTVEDAHLLSQKEDEKGMYWLISFNSVTGPASVSLKSLPKSTKLDVGVLGFSCPKNIRHQSSGTTSVSVEAEMRITLETRLEKVK